MTTDKGFGQAETQFMVDNPFKEIDLKEDEQLEQSDEPSEKKSQAHVDPDHVVRASLLLRKHWVPFTLYVLAFIHMGTIVGLYGPTLLLLAEQTNTSVRVQSILLGLRSFAFFLGSLLAGQLFDRYGFGNELLFLALFTASLVTVLLPLVSNVVAYSFCAIGLSVGLGVVDNISQVLLIRIFNANLNPFMQALHCGYGVGALVSPLVVGPFVSSEDNAPYDERYRYAYWIVALTATPTLVCLAIYILKLRGTAAYQLVDPTNESNVLMDTDGSRTSMDSGVFPSESREGGSGSELVSSTHHQSSESGNNHHNSFSINDNENSEHALLTNTNNTPADTTALEAKTSNTDVASGPTVLPRRLLLQLVAWMGVFLFLYVGCETGYGNLLATYAVQQLHFSTRRGADITLAFWSAFAAGRFIGIFASMVLHPGTMVRADLAVCCITLIGLVIFQSSEIALWVGSVLYGVAVATVYPSAMAWMSARIELSGKMLSYIVMAACAGDALVPMAEGLAFSGPAGPVGFLLVAMVCVLLATATFIVFQLVLPRIIRSAQVAHGEAVPLEGITARVPLEQDENQESERLILS
eukprot:m.31624 g.31624  ORF g.31624 m.31624 type:complete len:582 (+) comp9332_c0_seq2:848-2593(+)